MLPCELIERNGDALKRAITELARKWELPPEFLTWLDEACLFTNTLVDRIITGYPKDEAATLEQRLGYRDQLLVAGEPFHRWVIESPRPLEDELPLTRAGLDVVWTSDMTPYRERKVRILNGAHTLLTPAAFLAGKDTVREYIADPPALLALYRGSDVSDGARRGDRGGSPYWVRDETRVLEHFANVWGKSEGTYSRSFCRDLAHQSLNREDFWGCRLTDAAPSFTETVATSLHAICQHGTQAALRQLLDDERQQLRAAT